MSNSSRVLYNKYKALDISHYWNITQLFGLCLVHHQPSKDWTQVMFPASENMGSFKREKCGRKNILASTTQSLWWERERRANIPGFEILPFLFIFWESMNKSPLLLLSFPCEWTGTDACVMGIWQSWCDHHLKSFSKCNMGMLEKCCLCIPSWASIHRCMRGRTNLLFFFNENSI